MSASDSTLLHDIGQVAEIRRTPCGEGSMTWRIWGSGPDLVLLHGNLGSWNHWVHNVRELGRHYRVLAADIPGFGDSVLPPAPYSAQSVAQIMVDGIDAIAGKDAPVRIAGFSFGSGIGAVMAQILGARVRKFVLVSAGKDLEGVSRFDIPEFARWRDGKTEAEQRAAHRRNVEIIMIGDPANIDELAVDIQAGNAQRSRLRIDIINKARMHTACTPQLKCPLACIWGETDSTIGPNMHERVDWITRNFPDAPYRIIPGAGHWCAYEAPERFNRELLALLA